MVYILKPGKKQFFKGSRSRDHHRPAHEEEDEGDDAEQDDNDRNTNEDS
jgi:hypothetical protein